MRKRNGNGREARDTRTNHLWNLIWQKQKKKHKKSGRKSTEIKKIRRASRKTYRSGVKSGVCERGNANFAIERRVCDARCNFLRPIVDKKISAETRVFFFQYGETNVSHTRRGRFFYCSSIKGQTRRQFKIGPRLNPRAWTLSVLSLVRFNYGLLNVLVSGRSDRKGLHMRFNMRILLFASKPIYVAIIYAFFPLPSVRCDRFGWFLSEIVRHVLCDRFKLVKLGLCSVFRTKIGFFFYILL